MKKNKIAIILSRFPYPLDKGDKLRAYHQIKYLSNFFSIFLITLTDVPVTNNDIEQLSKYCTEIKIYKQPTLGKYINALLQLIKGKPIQVGYYYSSKIKIEMQHYLKSIPINLIFYQLLRTHPYYQRIEIPQVLDLQDAFSKNYERLFLSTKSIKKLFYYYEWKKIVAYEKEILSLYSTTTIISESDKSYINSTSSNIFVIPNGVDSTYYKPKAGVKKYDILFTGNLKYPPNEHAALYLIEEIYPLLKAHYPEIKILIAGKSPSKKLCTYQNKNIHISGWMDDLRDAYNESKLFVAPLFLGAGMQNKLLESMSMQMPCITTTQANSAIGATHRKEIIEANTAEEFSREIISLICNSEKINEIGNNARIFIEQKYSWENNTKDLKKIFENLIDQKSTA